MSPFEVLGLLPTATAEEVKQAFRRQAAIHHPDREHGNAMIFDEMRKAYEAALAEATAPKPCEACQGAGRVMKVNGWSKIDLLCTACEGTGEIK